MVLCSSVQMSKRLQLLGDRPQTPYRGSTPGSRWGTSVPHTPYLQILATPTAFIFILFCAVLSTATMSLYQFFPAILIWIFWLHILSKIKWYHPTKSRNRFKAILLTRKQTVKHTHGKSISRREPDLAGYSRTA